MDVIQHKIPLSTTVDRNTGLKATTLTNILGLVDRRGLLLAIYAIDPDNAVQNERLQITIDGVVVLNDAAWDIPNTDAFVALLASIAKGAVVESAETGAIGSLLDAKIGIPFYNQLRVDYLRAAAGTTGLTINIVYAQVRDILHTG